MDLRRDAEAIWQAAIAGAQPEAAVRRALRKWDPRGSICLVAIGKAAWQMASAACQSLGEQIVQGVVITKYRHARGAIGPLRIFEAGHPIPDANSYRAAGYALELVRNLTERDQVLFLISGGGSALFEYPLIHPAELEAVTGRLLACGADIVEINTIRKRLSAVKGGRFAQCCRPAGVFSVVLSDVVGDRLDMIASGPAYPDASTAENALAIVRKYGLALSPEAMSCLARETPRTLDNVETVIAGNVRQLCESACAAAEALGYQPVLLTDSLTCEAREAGAFLASIARTHCAASRSLACIAGGETVVHLRGDGLGGRNQELALAAAPGIMGLRNAAVFSVGSDGTDGPTDAAGGYVDGSTARALSRRGVSISAVLDGNDSYHALKSCGGLVVTGPTGTNVNDLSAVLIRAGQPPEAAS